MRTLMMVAAFSAAAATGVPARATTILGFDNIPDGVIPVRRFNGMTISGASVIALDPLTGAYPPGPVIPPGAYPPGPITPPSAAYPPGPIFPPVSGSKVIYDYADGTITLNFSTQVDSIGAYITGNTPITLNAYHGTTLFYSVSTPGANQVGSGNDSNIFLSLFLREGITSAVFTNGLGIGNTFTLDDLTIGGDVTTNLPEPASWAIMIVGIGMAGGAMRQRRRMAVRYA